MLRISGLMLVFAAITLGGCTNPKQANYSCGTDVSQRTAEVMKVAPVKDKAGDPSCE